MSVLKKFKKKFISKLRRIRKHYRYKVYFPKVYSSYCTEPVQENKVLFLEMRFTKLSNSFELIYKALEESGEYDLKCSYVQFNFIRGREFTQRVNEMLKELATAKYVFVDDASLILSSIPLRKETVAINLWHACGAFKKFGRSTAELKFGSSAATLDKYPNYGNLTHVTVSSPEVIWAYEEAMHLPKGIVKATGVSRTDQFYDKEFVESRKQKLYEIMPEAVVSWPKYARLARSLVMKIRHEDYIYAAIVTGSKTSYILRKYMFPNIIPTLIITAATDIGGMMLELAGLSFLGFGAKAPAAEWGLMLNEGRTYMQNAPWMMIYPGLAIIIVVVVFNLLGDSLRDVLDVREE